jgi:hypothetical protein
MKIINEEKRIKILDREILNKRKNLRDLDKDSYFHSSTFSLSNKRDLENELRIKETERQQLLDSRNNFYSKLFFNMIIPIIVSFLTTVFINYFLYR